MILIWWGSYGFGGGPTIGDLMAVDNMSRYLAELGIDHAVVSHPELRLDHHLAVANIYSIKPAQKVVFVCGPLTENRDLRDFLEIQQKAKKIAVGVSVLDSQGTMNRSLVGLFREMVSSRHISISPF